MRIQTLLYTFALKSFLLFTIFFFIGNDASAFDKSPSLLIFDKENKSYSVQLDCDNLTEGGSIEGDETGLGTPTFDPALITSVSLPTGGSGEVQYLWVYTEDDPNMSFAQWLPISNTNSSEFDPPAISKTTHFMRCARRADCVDYVAESNYVTKAIVICDNVTNGGLISSNQQGNAPFQPDDLVNLIAPSGGSGALEYLWLSSIVGPPYIQGSPNWTEISNSNSPTYTPGILSETTYFIRCVRREDCNDYIGESNLITITVNTPIEQECDNVTTGGIIAINQEGDAPFEPDDLINTALPTGGTGQLEYLWLFSTTNSTYIQGSPDWSVIPNSNTPNYDPGVLNQTTYFIRCVRRSDCEDYLGESNVITITVNADEIECDNVTNGGMIATDQEGDAPFEPDNLVNAVWPIGGGGALEYLWYSSTISSVYIEGSPDWIAIPNSNLANYNPGVLNQTTYYIRCARRTNCNDYLGKSNVIKITVNPNEVECDNVTNGGMIAANQEGDAPFEPDDLVNTALPTGGTGQLEYLWFSSTITSVYSQGSPDWLAIPNSNTPDYDPGVLTESIHFIRCVRRTNCEDYIGESNVIKIIVNTEVAECDNVTTGGMIGFNQQSCSSFDPGNLDNTLSPTGGTGELEYLWLMSTITPVYIQGSPDWVEIPNSNIPAYDPSLISETTYFIRCVRRTNCEDYLGESNVITLSVFQDLALTIDNIQDVECFGESTGSVAITVSSGTEPYSYEWSDNIAAVEDPTGLAAGVYTLTVTDSNGCVAIQEVEIASPTALIVDTMFGIPTCNGGSDGFASITLSGGSPPFASYWDDANATTGNNLSNLSAGEYTVFITDDNGCQFSNEITITEPAINPTFTINVEVQDASCIGNNDGSATINIPEAGTYTYLWNDPQATTGNTLSNASPGVYNVTVTPEDACPISQNVIIGTSTNLVLQFSSTDETCAGTMDGTATVEVEGGTPPYSIQWDDAANTNNAVLENLTAGIYSVTVTESNGCTASGEISVSTGSGLTLDINQQNVSCFGSSDGFAIVTPINGTAPYQYEWANINSDNSTVAGLSLGNYIVSVTDANGCIGVTEVEISQPTELNLTILADDVLCAEDLTDIETSISGGTAPYSYNWNTGATSSNLTNISTGTYTLTVTDANNCPQEASITVNFTSNFTATASATNISCAGENDGTATIVTNSSDFDVLWSTNQSETTITNLAAGTYTATITDENGCEIVTSVDIFEPAPLVLDLSVQSEISEQGASDGVAVATTTGGIGEYNYSWSNGSISPVVSNLVAGTYTVTVLDENGCTTINEITLIDGPNLTIEIGNYVWYDGNADGIQQAFEEGMGNIMVMLISTETNTPVNTQLTNNEGYYSFEDVQPGEYVIEFMISSVPGNMVLSPQDMGNNNLVDSDADPTTGQTDPFLVVEYQEDGYNFDAGLRPKCLNVNDGGAIATSQEVCSNEVPNIITSVHLPSGGSGGLEYLWIQSNTGLYNGPGDPNWTEVPNSNSPDYQPGILNETTYFVRCARRECCIEYPGESNIVSVTVNNLPYVNIANAPSDACTDQGYTFEASAASGNAAYLWDFGAGATPQTSSTRETDDVSWSSEGDKTVSLTITRAGCSLTVTTLVSVNNCPGFTGGFDNFVANIINENTVSLTWMTETNDENSIFFIEESRLGNEFETIATMDGYANSGVNVYQYSDTELFLGMNHYRVRQVRSNGTSDLSDIEWVNYLPANSPEVRVFPNPFNNKFTVNVLLPQEENMLLRLISPQGNILASEVLEAETYQGSFDLSAYPSGLYIVRIYYGEGKEVTEKLIKR